MHTRALIMLALLVACDDATDPAVPFDAEAPAADADAPPRDAGRFDVGDRGGREDATAAADFGVEPDAAATVDAGGDTAPPRDAGLDAAAGPDADAGDGALTVDFGVPAPDAGLRRDAAPAPDADPEPDAAVGPDGAVDPDGAAGVDAGVDPDAALPLHPDAAPPPDPDAAPAPDAPPPEPPPPLPACALLQNPGAEAADLRGWTLEAGDFQARAEQAFSIPAPASGARLFFAGRAERSRLRQDVDVVDFAPYADDEGLYAALTAQVRTWTGDDRASLELHALDAAGDAIGAVASDLFADDDWRERRIGFAVPRGTATLRVVLVGERRRGQDNDAYFDDVELCLTDAPPPPVQADAAVPPYLMWVTPDAVSVLWETDDAVRGFVDVDGRRFEEPEARTLHELRLTGLDADTEYTYVAGQQDQAFAPATFRTAPDPEAGVPFDFIVWGDNQNGPATFTRLVDVMVQQAPAWAASVGDCVQWGLADLYRSEMLRPIHPLASFAPFLVAAGNHERLIDFGARLFGDYMAQPGDEHCFGYRYGEAFFLFLDTDLPYGEGSAQYGCAADALSSDAARTATLRAALFHKPPRVEYWAGFCYTGESTVREDLTPLFAEHGVDVVFNGHNHLYAYTPPGADGITWVTTGGGGGAIDDEGDFCRRWDAITETQFVHHFLAVHVEDGRMLVRAIDLEGAELHRFEVPPQE